MKAIANNIDVMQTSNRSEHNIYQGQSTSDGAGVQLRRIIGTQDINHFDPFLLFDVFSSDDPTAYIGGFPAHPHRGFETVTYLFAGRMRHKDNQGHEGIIEPGGVQWMRAARGIIHSEMPEQQDGLLSGIQLWINLPQSMKMSEPGYQEYSAQHIPVESGMGDSTVRVIAGRFGSSIIGPVKGIPTDPLFLDVELPEGQRFTQSIEDSHAAIVYVHEGSLQIVSDSSGEESSIVKGSLATLSGGQHIHIDANQHSRFLLVSARTLNEPIARGGPFVMNNQAEIKQAFKDYEAGIM